MLGNRVGGAVASTATTISIGAAITGWRQISDDGVDGTTYLLALVDPGAGFEVGTYTYNRSAGTLTRVSCLLSSSGTSWISASASASIVGAMNADIPASLDQVRAVYFMAAGDGTTDDSVSLNAASAYISFSGGNGVINLDAGKTYYVKSTVLLMPGVSIEGHGATLKTDQTIIMVSSPSLVVSSAGGLVNNPQSTLVDVQLTANPSVGSNQLTVNSTTSLSVGDKVHVRMGDNAWDTAEARWTMLARILGISGSVLSLDRYIPYGPSSQFPLNAMAAVTTGHKDVFKLKYYCENQSIRQLNLECSANANIQAGIFLDCAHDMVIEQVTGNALGGANMGAGLVMLANCEAVTIRRTCLFANLNNNSGSQASLGRMFNFWNCRDISVEDAEGRNLWSDFYFIEGYCERIIFRNVAVRHPNWGSSIRSDYANMPILASVQASEVFVNDLHVEYRAAVVLDDIGASSGRHHIRDLTWHGIMPTAALNPAFTSMSGRLDFNDGTNFILVDFDDVREYYLKWNLVDSYVLPIELEWGFICDWEVHVPTTIHSLSAVYLMGYSMASWISAGKGSEATVRACSARTVFTRPGIPAVCRSSSRDRSLIPTPVRAAAATSSSATQSPASWPNRVATTRRTIPTRTDTLMEQHLEQGGSRLLAARSVVVY